MVHLKCLPQVNKTDSVYTERESNDWSCTKCNQSLFPFNHYYDDTDYFSAIDEQFIAQSSVPFDMLVKSDLLFSPFDTNDSDFNCMNDIDPDVHFYNSHLNSDSLSCEYYLEDMFNSKISNMNILANNLSMLNTNIRSMPKNLSKLKCYLENLNHKFTIHSFTESWISNHSAGLYGMEGYNVEHNYRKDRKGGGVSLFISEEVEYQLRDDLTIQNQYMETLFVELTNNTGFKNKNVICGVVYRPPNTDMKLFNEKMSELLDKIRSDGKLAYIMGDYNINIINSEHVETQNFIDMMFEYGFIPCINKPTRVTSRSATLIDNIFTNNYSSYDSALNGILYTDVSDHFPIFHIDVLSSVDNTPKYVQRRDFSKDNIDKFNTLIADIEWNDVLASDDTQSAYSLFHNKFSSLYDECFPLRYVKLGYKDRKPWLSDGLKLSIKHKNKLFKRKNKNPDLEAEYKSYRNLLNSLLHKAERDYYRSLLTKCRNNMKKSWKMLKDIINHKKQSASCSRFKINDVITSDKKRICNGFNDFYINVGSNLAKKIPDSDKTPKDFIRNCNQNSMFVESVSDSDVCKIVTSLKSASSGWDGISLDVVKRAFMSIVQPLTHCMNLSLMNGVVPNELKIARVIPLFKAGDIAIFSNYRPVSVLPLFSKILERLMYARLLSFINQNKLLYKFQFGFRQGHSPELALIYLIDKISNSLENGEYVLGVFLDFSKAFDTVNHDILFDKLEMYGIRGVALKWFKSYLSNRYQYVVYNGEQSDRKLITCGVPQGSILGPLLFLLYINDLADVSDKLFALLFADDSNMFISGKDIDELVNSMNTEMEKVIDWLNVNKLSLNLKKTHYMIFRGRRTKIDVKNKLMINGTVITMERKTKFLGVIIDENLLFRDHIKYVKGKISRSLGILYKCRKYFDSDTLLMLYNSFVYPHFTYCLSVWGNTCKSYLSPILSLQDRAVRLISGVKRDHEMPILYEKHGLLPFHKIYVYSVQCFAYKFHHDTLPEIFRKFFIRNSDVHQINTKSKSLLHVPICRSESRSISVSFSGVRCYNHLYNQLPLNTVLYQYKMNLKIYLRTNDLKNILDSPK